MQPQLIQLETGEHPLELFQGLLEVKDLNPRKSLLSKALTNTLMGLLIDNATLFASTNIPKILINRVSLRCLSLKAKNAVH